MVETITQQQECGYREYLKSGKDLSFWTWYWYWCFEEGLFYDRASYQGDIE